MVVRTVLCNGGEVDRVMDVEVMSEVDSKISREICCVGAVMKGVEVTEVGN